MIEKCTIMVQLDQMVISVYLYLSTNYGPRPAWVSTNNQKTARFDENRNL